jgi:hypothetical protein
MFFRDGDSLSLNVLEILKYFDMNPDQGHHHATPLRGLFGEDLAIALLKRYFRTAEGKTAKVIRDEPKEEKPGRSKLDCWLSVNGTPVPGGD